MDAQSTARHLLQFIAFTVRQDQTESCLMQCVLLGMLHMCTHAHAHMGAGCLLYFTPSSVQTLSCARALEERLLSFNETSAACQIQSSILNSSEVQATRDVNVCHCQDPLVLHAAPAQDCQ